jgi:hypothetical protein
LGEEIAIDATGDSVTAEVGVGGVTKHVKPWMLSSYFHRSIA